MHPSTRIASVGIYAAPQPVPAWDKFMHRLVGLHDNRTIPNKRDRFLLDQNILERMPSSSGRYIKGIRDFMQTWLWKASYRDRLMERLLQDPLLAEVRLRVGKVHEDGRIYLSLATRKGFVSVCFTQTEYES